MESPRTRGLSILRTGDEAGEGATDGATGRENSRSGWENGALQMDTLIPFLAFLGGVAAVAAKSWLDYLLERRRERRAVRSAARLISEELSSIGVHASVVEDVAEWSEPGEWAFDHDIWRENKALLSSNLDYHGWLAVASGYRSVRSFESVPEWAPRDNDELWPKLDAANLQLVRLDKQGIDRAQEALYWIARRGRSRFPGRVRRYVLRTRRRLRLRASVPARARGADS